MKHNKPRRPRTSFGKKAKRVDIPAGVKSSWEANIYRLYQHLKDTGVILDFSYEPRRYTFTNKNGTPKRGNAAFYIPDFEITYPDGKSILLEVKGFMDKTSKIKLDRMAKQYPDVTIDIIGKDAYKALASEYSGIVPNWE
ncbi:MAG: DUF1064 domain-containing protein [Candidatus Competibacteraceae bacterium]|nr:DUF1064 domain-containing protein [Candidatus Competibacteraceae bacterium]